jgi:hypothetical protein
MGCSSNKPLLPLNDAQYRGILLEYLKPPEMGAFYNLYIVYKCFLLLAIKKATRISDSFNTP